MCLYKNTTNSSHSKLTHLKQNCQCGINNKKRYGAELLTFDSITVREKYYRVLSLCDFNTLSDSRAHYHYRDFCLSAKLDEIACYETIIALDRCFYARMLPIYEPRNLFQMAGEHLQTRLARSDALPLHLLHLIRHLPIAVE